jgi:hypothetical protein
VIGISTLAGAEETFSDDGGGGPIGTAVIGISTLDGEKAE